MPVALHTKIKQRKRLSSKTNVSGSNFLIHTFNMPVMCMQSIRVLNRILCDKLISLSCTVSVHTRSIDLQLNKMAKLTKMYFYQNLFFFFSFFFSVSKVFMYMFNMSIIRIQSISLL